MSIPDREGTITYADAGVDIDAGNAFVKAIAPLIRSTRRPGADGKIGGFGGIFDLGALNYRDPLLVAANDGVGTKLKIAIEAGRHDTIGIDLVAMCVNDLIVQGAEPLFFLDYYATGHLDIGIGEAIVAGIAEGCRQSACALIGGETAEMPNMYHGEDYDLAGFSVGMVERDKLLPRASLKEGDVLLGLAADGLHSNGFSLVRKVMERRNISCSDPCPFETGKTLGEALLTPTRIYVAPLLAALKETSGIKALAHITGGGLPENLPRVLADGLSAEIDLSAISIPPVFSWLREGGMVDDLEMLRTFNCGIGMVLVVDCQETDAISAHLASSGESVVRLGRIVAEDHDSVRFANSLNWATQA